MAKPDISLSAYASEDDYRAHDSEYTLLINADHWRNLYCCLPKRWQDRIGKIDAPVVLTHKDSYELMEALDECIEYEESVRGQCSMSNTELRDDLDAAAEIAGHVADPGCATWLLVVEKANAASSASATT